MAQVTNNHTRTCDVVCLTPVVVFELSGRDFSNLLNTRQHVAVAIRVLQSLQALMSLDIRVRDLVGAFEHRHAPRPGGERLAAEGRRFSIRFSAALSFRCSAGVALVPSKEVSRRYRRARSSRTRGTRRSSASSARARPSSRRSATAVSGWRRARRSPRSSDARSPCGSARATTSARRASATKGTSSRRRAASASRTSCSTSSRSATSTCPRSRAGDVPRTGRGDAAAATWAFRGDESRPRRG